MRFTLRRIGRVMFLRWNAAPEFGDLTAIVRTLSAARHEVGGQLVQVEVAPADTGLPTAEATHEAMRELRAFRYLRGMHAVVIEGDSVRRAVVRGIYNVMAFIADEQLVMCDTVEQAVERVCNTVGQDPRDVLRELDAAGLLHPTTSANA